MTLKKALLISMIGLVLHILLSLFATGAPGLVKVVDLILFEGSLLFFMVVFYLKQ